MQGEDIAQAKINRGQRSRQLLDDPVLNEAFIALMEDADAAADNSKPHESDLREECYRAKQAIKAVRKKLAIWVSDAAIERKYLDEINQKNAAKAGEDVAA